MILPPPPNNSFSTPLGRNFANNLENVSRSEEPRHKISILWHSGLLDMFLHRTPKTALKNTQNLPLYSILKVTFPEIFKKESFRFSQYSQNFFSTYASVPQIASQITETHGNQLVRLLKNFDEILEKLPVLGPFPRPPQEGWGVEHDTKRLCLICAFCT